VISPFQRGDLPGDLVHVADGRDAGAEVKELVGPAIEAPVHHLMQESALRACPELLGGVGCERPASVPAVNREIVRAAEQKVIDTDAVGLGSVRGRPEPPGGHLCLPFSDSGAATMLVEPVVRVVSGRGQPGECVGVGGCPVPRW
jgi:hypothetical protein